MAQRTRSNGSSPFEAAVENIERELGKLQKQLRSGRKDLEKRIQKSRKQLLSDVKKNPAFKRAQTLRKDAEKQLESGIENMLSAFQIASKRDVDRIDRRLKTINKKLTDIEKGASA
jgi:hypothetical protein